MKNILIVDDNFQYRSNLSHLIGKEWPGVVVVEAGSLAEAREAMYGNRFDLVFLDRELPDGYGIDLLELIYAHNTCLVVGMSASPEMAKEMVKKTGLAFLKSLESKDLALIKAWADKIL